MDGVPSAWLEVQKKRGWVPDAGSQGRKEEWGHLRAFLEKGFRLLERDEWTKVFHGQFALVYLNLVEAFINLTLTSINSQQVPTRV